MSKPTDEDSDQNDADRCIRDYKEIHSMVKRRHQYSRYTFTISVIEAYNNLVPDKRCPQTGIMRTVEYAFENCFPVPIEDMLGIQEVARQCYGNQRIECFVNREFLFMAIGSKIVRVMPFNPAYEYGFHPYAITNFEQHVNPRLKRDGIHVDILSDYLKARPFNIAQRNPKIIKSVERHHNINDCHFVATKYCVYVLKKDVVIRTFLFYAAHYDEQEQYTFSKHAKERAIEHFGHLIKSNVIDWLCRRIDVATEDKRIYNNSAFISDVAQAYPDIDVKFLIDGEYGVVFVVCRENNSVLTVQPRERDWFRPLNPRFRKRKSAQNHCYANQRAKQHPSTKPYDRKKERQLDYRQLM